MVEVRSGVISTLLTTLLNHMITLGQARIDINEIVNKYRPQLNSKYEKFYFTNDERGSFLTFYIKNGEKLTLRAIVDSSRKKLIPPKYSMEYQKQGGHKALFERIQYTNKEAWKMKLNKHSEIRLWK